MECTCLCVVRSVRMYYADSIHNCVDLVNVNDIDCNYTLIVCMIWQFTDTKTKHTQEAKIKCENEIEDLMTVD